MKRSISLLFLACLLVCNASAQNWDINTLHKVNSWDGKFIRNYNKVISRTEPYIAVGVPVAMALTAWAKHDRELLKDAVYVGTSVAGTFVLTYGMKYLVDRERPFDRYPDRVHAYSYESSPSFPSAHTATAFALATSLSIKYPKWYVIAPSAFWACSVGVSRMNEGVHYPSDVLAGAAIGAGCAVVNIYVNRWLNKWLFGN
ncbi:phosphatase PAP2 family protein [uncultured Bacteroides sp.]|uniref:phosphatase PAP2 family protein n=1 Tax=uncultured Bacteroides sp. TaxID=162156 RepID=UPI0026216987|nr:phosphatase PAP2 family protein [uncultured Bacteroides sp.]